jgi:hypothetical protein
MGRIMEVREFIAAYFQIIKSFEALAQLVPQHVYEQESKKGTRFVPLKYDYSSHRQFVNEVLLARAVESFELYVLTILRELFVAQPNMLKSESPVDAATVITLRNFDDIVFHLAERRLHDLSYKPLSELNSYIVSRTGIPLFKDEETLHGGILATEVRNLIAHNDCKVNDQFRRRVVGIQCAVPIPEAGKFSVEDKWLRQVCYLLDGVVFDFDALAMSKFDLKSASERGFLLDR